MKFKSTLFAGVLLSLAAAGGNAARQTSLSLNGAWQLKGWPTPVPGCYEPDLCAAGLLPNLFYANNQYAARKYEGHQWLYTRTFALGNVPLCELLDFEQISKNLV